MAVFSVACIVEGHGEIPAVPILIRRLVELVNPAVHANVQRPIRKPSGTLLREGGIEGAVELAVRGLPESGFVLIVTDSDDSCPKELGPELLARALHTAAGRRPVGVVLAKKEFESWFIAAAESIAGHSGPRPDLCAPADPESIREAKGWLQKAMPPGRKYSETVDQPSLASRFDLNAARRAPSFDKLCREIERVLSQSRFKVEEAVPLIDQRLQQIFREAFDNDKLSVTDSLSPETMPEWDSLVQVKLIVGCEEEFGVKFSIEATIESNSVGKLKSVLVAKGVAS